MAESKTCADCVYYIRRDYIFGLCERVFRSRKPEWNCCSYFIEKAEDDPGEQKDE